MTVFICTGNPGKLEEFKHALHTQEKILGLNDIYPMVQEKYLEPKENSEYFICNAAIKLFSALKFIVENSNNNLLSEINKIIVDDSGLCVPALNYLPGVHSASFAGFPKNDSKNNSLLKQEIEKNLNAVNYKSDKRLKAFFVCFLLSLQIQNFKDFEFIKSANFSEAQRLLTMNENVANIIAFEKKLLNKVDLNIYGGAISEKISASLLYEKFPEKISINIDYGFCCGEVSTQEQNNIPGAGHGYDPLFYPLGSPELSFASIPLSEKNKISHRAFAVECLKNRN